VVRDVRHVDQHHLRRIKASTAAATPPPPPTTRAPTGPAC
jgi:hypothetical protein